MPLYILDDLANLIFIGAYWVKDILWLRLLSILGSLIVIPYYLLQAEPLWTPMMWSCVFIGIHATRSWGIVRGRQPVEFTGDEQLLYESAFSSLSPQQFKHVVAIGEWHELDLGHVVHSAGDSPESLEAVVRGEVEARKDGRLLGCSVPGDLIGLTSLLGGAPEVYDSTVTRAARVMRWSRRDLEELAGGDESLAAALRKIAGAAISEKLIRLLQAGE
jgi:hypothetical protein